MATVVLETQFEDGATFELMEFLAQAEDKTASVTAFIPITWVGSDYGHPKRARLLEDDGDYTVEMTDGEWDAEEHEG